MIEFKNDIIQDARDEEIRELTKNSIAKYCGHLRGGLNDNSFNSYDIRTHIYKCFSDVKLTGYCDITQDICSDDKLDCIKVQRLIEDMSLPIQCVRCKNLRIDSIELIYCVLTDCELYHYQKEFEDKIYFEILSEF